MTHETEYERRKRTLTEEDIEAIIEASAKACPQPGPCPHGVTPEEIHELKHFAGMLMKVKMAIGNTVLYAVIAGIVVLFYLGASKIKGQ